MLPDSREKLAWDWLVIFGVLFNMVEIPLSPRSPRAAVSIDTAAFLGLAPRSQC